MAMQISSRAPMADINVTPMVDVVLVLLIIFMVTAPMIRQGVPVELPAANARALPAEQQERAVLTVTKDREVFLGDTPIALAELKERLAGNLKLAKDGQLFVHADRALAYGFVVDVMTTVQAAGVSNVGLVTDPVGKASGRGR